MDDRPSFPVVEGKKRESVYTEPASGFPAKTSEMSEVTRRDWWEGVIDTSSNSCENRCGNGRLTDLPGVWNNVCFPCSSCICSSEDPSVDPWRLTYLSRSLADGLQQPLWQRPENQSRDSLGFPPLRPACPRVPVSLPSFWWVRRVSTG